MGVSGSLVSQGSCGGVSARTLSHPLPQSPAERRDVAVPTEPECLAREGLRRGGVPPHPASLMLIACARALRARGDAARPCRVRMRPGKRPRLPTCCARAAVHGAHGGACVDGDNALMALMARPRALDDSNAVQASRAPLSHALRDAAHVVPRLAARRAPSLRMWRVKTFAKFAQSNVRLPG